VEERKKASVVCDISEGSDDVAEESKHSEISEGLVNSSSIIEGQENKKNNSLLAAVSPY
jgi:hypothetical protein